MKASKFMTLAVLVLTITFYSNAQVVSNVESIAPFNEGLAAIKKGNTWGFIDTKGTVVIDFRQDVTTYDKQLPRFNDGLCLIQEQRDGIMYYGYINTSGEQVISPEYLAATPFENGFARIVKYYKTETGNTNALGKKIITYSYNELVIDTKNETVQHLRGPFNLVFDRVKLRQNPPTINSKFINEHLISVKERDNTHTIYNLKKQ